MSFFSGRPASTSHRLLSAAASANATLVIERPASLKGIQGHVAAATPVYLKLYDMANEPSEADTPVKTLYLPASASFSFDFPAGFDFASGIGYRITGAAADADTTALVAADVLALNLDYL
jgi:hypothetical protein